MKESLLETLHLINKLCNTSLSEEDIDDALLSNVEEKRAFIQKLENAKAAIELKQIQDLIVRLEKIK